MSLQVEMLGGFALRDASHRPSTLPTKKTKALLAYLAVHAGEPQSRDCLMTLLWGDCCTRNARHSLNQALVSIRKLDVGEDAPLLESGDGIVTARRQSVESDLDQFRSRVSSDPTRAVALYKGDFLLGVTTSSDEFEHWAADLRAALRERCCDALERAAALAAQDGDLERGLSHARRLVKLDPLRESGQRCLIQLLHRTGNRRAALRQYDIYADALEAELGIGPSTESQRLAEQIRVEADGDEGTVTRQRASGAVAMPRAQSSIAVLPFEALDCEAASAQLADGIAVELITELTEFRWFEVLAHAPGCQDSSTTDDLRRSYHALGARYCVEAKIRCTDRCARVSIQLLDLERGSCIWAQRFTRWLEDGIALQEALARAIAAQLEPVLAKAEYRRARCRARTNIDAWEHYLQGMWFLECAGDAFKRAKSGLAAAVDLDHRFAPALAALSHVYSRELIDGVCDDGPEALDAALGYSQRAVDADTQDPYAHYARGRALTLKGGFAAAHSAFQTALRLCPSSVLSYEGLAKLLTSIGRPDDAIRHLKQALLLSPNHPRRRLMTWEMGRALFSMSKFENAVGWLDTSTALGESWYAHLTRAQALTQLARPQEAGDALTAARRCLPALSPQWLQGYRRTIPASLVSSSVRTMQVEALRKLGFYD